jgi:hypothetical protein
MAKMNQKFTLALRLYEESCVGVVSRGRHEREPWMGTREDDYRRCEEAMAKLEQLWIYRPEDLDALKAVHRKFIDRYRQSRHDEAEWVFKDIDELIASLRDK